MSTENVRGIDYVPPRDELIALAVECVTAERRRRAVHATAEAEVQAEWDRAGWKTGNSTGFFYAVKRRISELSGEKDRLGELVGYVWMLAEIVADELGTKGATA